MKKQLPLVSLLISLFALSGCHHMKVGLPQEVVILSFPSESSVYIDGVPVGITPMTIELPRKISHEVRLERAGYNAAVKYFTPVPNDKAQNFIRFGLSEDLGHYVDLTPGTMKSEMESDLVPASTGTDPFATMAQNALEADQRLERGEITPMEHKVIIEQIIEFFESQG